MPGSLYTGVAGNVSLGSSVQATVPADGDTDNAATFTVGMQKEADYLEAMRALLFSAPGIPLNETFDGATFPPVNPSGAWAAPSPRFGADLAYVRDTATPITGTASANRPGSQTASTNSSLGLTLAFATPGRLIFDFQVTGNLTAGDHLDFFVDGVQVGKFYSRAGPSTEAGRFVSEVLREGQHTFDWRFVRGGSASVGGEQAKIDNVQMVPELLWPMDTANRFHFWDDFTGPASGTTLPNGWLELHGTGAGTIGYTLVGTGYGTRLAEGILHLQNAANVNDWSEVRPFNNIPFGNAAPQLTVGLTAGRYPYMEAVCGPGSLVASNFIAAGFAGVAAGADPKAEEVAVIYDGNINGNWQIRCETASVSTLVDTGIAVTAGLHRIGLSWSPLGVVATIDGLAIPGSTATFFTCTSNVLKTSTVAYIPYFQSAAHNGTAGQTIFEIDSCRVMALRP